MDVTLWHESVVDGQAFRILCSEVLSIQMYLHTSGLELLYWCMHLVFTGKEGNADVDVRRINRSDQPCADSVRSRIRHRTQP